MEHSLCVTCGTQYSASEEPPGCCVICEDDRQYVPPAGQQWTMLAREQEQGRHTNTVAEIAPGIVTISTEPKLGIGQHAHLLRTEGGIAAIAVPHPHFVMTSKA